MFDRLRNAITSNPWRTAAIALAVSLAASLALLIPGREQPVAEAVDTTTTTTTSPATSTTVALSVTTSSLGQANPGRSTEALIAIKVDNAPPARPQWGLALAPVLVEYPVEGGITRYVALVPRGQAGLVGPIRSLRPTDPDLLVTMAGAVVSTGGQAFVIQDVEAAGLISVGAEFSSMFPSVGNPDPHDTFVDLALLEEILAADLGETTGLPRGSLPQGLDQATEVTLPFFDLTLLYEEGVGYVHHRNGTPIETLDQQGENATPLAHETVVVLEVGERSAGYHDVNGSEVSKFDVIGGGDLVIFHGGAAMAGGWFRGAFADGFEFRDSLGTPAGLPDGTVYLAIVPRGDVLSYR